MNSNIKYLVESFIDDEEEIIDVDINFNREKFVDLGLPSETLWATRNLGANSPTLFGLYYQCGSLEGHEAKTFDFNYNDYFKHYDKDYYGLTELKKEDDAAYVESEGLARIPTKELIQELIDNCEYKWTSLNGVNGAKFTGPNGYSIFIPAAGYCADNSVHSVGSYVFILSLSLNPDDPQYTYYMYCDFSEDNCYDGDRYVGFSIRPVFIKSKLLYV